MPLISLVRLVLLHHRAPNMSGYRATTGGKGMSTAGSAADGRSRRQGYHAWVPGHWREHDGQWYFVEGHWRA